MPPTSATLSDILSTPPLQAVLSLIDMTCGRAAAVFSGGRVVTGTIDDVRIYADMFPNDVAECVADVAATGSSSILLRFIVRIHGERVADGVATFVATNDDGTPRRVDQSVDELQFESRRGQISGGELMKRVKKDRKLLYEDDQRTLMAAADAACNFASLLDVKFASRLSQKEGRVRIRKQFLPRHLNFAGVVFGGDILAVLMDVAAAAARKVAKDVRVIGMREVAFLRPVPMEKVLEVEASVAVVGGGIGVVVTSWIDEHHDGSELLMAHRGVLHLSGKGGVGVEEGKDFYRAVALGVGGRVGDAWGVDKYPLVEGVEYS